tara:strand:- start:8992 stop:11820 length:2829 start_codon:yes stop_codon:yes gene_type:complete
MLPLTSYAQDNFPINGVRSTNQITYAFINADIYIDYNKIISNATLLIKNDRILKVGSNIKIPNDAKIIDLNGYKICPSFIDIYTDYGQKTNFSDIELSSWNSALNTEFNAINNFEIDLNKAESFIKNGFGIVNSLNKDGIIRGSSTLVSLSYDKPHSSVIIDQSALCLSFNKGASKTKYPSSLMGSIALIRQAYYDADWYDGQKHIYNNSLRAFNIKRDLPKIFEVSNYQSIFRANKIANEFKEKYIIKTNGDEYKRVEELKNLDIPLIVPINFDKLKINTDPYENLNISLASLKHAETAPYNFSILVNHGIDVALTLDGLDSFSDFYKNLKTIISTGVNKNEILKSLTYNPANFLNVYNQTGSLEKGKKANFLIFSGDLFSNNFLIYENWINGKKFVVNNKNIQKLIGKYNFFIDGNKGNEISFFVKNNKICAQADTSKKESIDNIKLFNKQISFIKNGIFFNGTFSDSLIYGELYDSLGHWNTWQLVKFSTDNKLSPSNPDSISTHSKILYPNMAYGLQSNPIQQSILFINATVWTNEEAGIVENCDVAIQDGKILAVGEKINLNIFKSPSNVVLIDASNKHITSGIIDEHSHIAISRGVNEGTQAVTSEVRIGDVINSDDINIYRQLAGGVTIAQLLHGSANPIGGQSAIIKLRWGQSAENLKYHLAKPFIKFALGENVKQSNWGSQYRTRFPQTRMGVEQIIYDAFVRAKEYKENNQAYRKNKKLQKPRKNLELDALVEIMDGKRLVTCHSYVQSEILMLMDIANQFNFKINTFTHILEGYKVAGQLKLHGANASTFSDWWAYKYEVNDAIPYNAALLIDAGVNTAINSDDAEMGRRLNQEAAKIVKYGHVSYEEAWKSVTLNPAKMLQIDQYVGSLKENKDADIVIWSSNPLSMYSKVEKTFIDGRCYYSIEQDLEHREIIKTEKSRLLNKMIKNQK